ncbi:MAG: CpsD/CapB family tyrosine-protein kinase [Clostridiales bacterium]|nr:CpsD/CapB family tyrosine-protein kinase [Clostridiales bacterium]
MGICAIWGAPQSGKTTLAVNLAYTISRGDKTVCLISPKTYSELSALLGVKITEEHSLRAALRGTENIKQTVFKVDELFYVLTAPVTGDLLDDHYTSDQARSLLEQARMTFDIVIVDCPSDTNNLFAAWSLNKAETVILTYGGRLSCAMWHTTNIRALQAIQNKAVHVRSEVTSDFDYDGMHMLLKCMPDIRIPYIPEATLLHNGNKLLVQLAGKKSEAYLKAVNQLCGVIMI